jgi:hypothetical protein
MDWNILGTMATTRVKQLHNWDMNLHHTLKDTVSTPYSQYLHGTALLFCCQCLDTNYSMGSDSWGAGNCSQQQHLLQHRDGGIFSPAGVTARTTQVHISHTVATSIGSRAQRQRPQWSRWQSPLYSTKNKALHKYTTADCAPRWLTYTKCKI